MADEELPAPADLARLPIFPLPQAVLFPGALLPLHIFEERYREMIRDVLAGRKLLAVARLKPGFEASYAARPPVFEHCGVGRVIDHVAYADGRFDILLRGLSRIRIAEELPAERAYRVVRATLLADAPVDPLVGQALRQEVGELWRALEPELPPVIRDLAELTRDADQPGEFADRVAAAVVSDTDTSQQLLAELDPSERLHLVAERLRELLDAVSPDAGRAASLN